MGATFKYSLLLSFVVTCATARLIRGGSSIDDEQFHRRLYETDDDGRSCLEDAACRFSLGILLILLTPVLIWWNEHQHAKLTALYGAAKRVVHDIPSLSEAPYDDCDGEFVCFSGMLEGGSNLTDPLFPTVQAKDVILLARDMEILQYVEKSKGKNKYELKEQWCKIPQRDPPHFKDKKNPIGNWTVFSSERMVNTGHKFQGDPILFGDNVVAVRASNPRIGQFAIPPDLLDEAFFGKRHIHRLHQLNLIEDCQGTWTKVRTEASCYSVVEYSAMDENGLPIVCRKMEDGYVCDNDMGVIGTIRFRWRSVKAQNMTVAAEAVAPGRTCAGGYGSYGRNIESEPSSMKNMILSELFSENETSPLFREPKMKMLETQLWTVTPYSVQRSRCFPSFNNQFLGYLWLFAPGIMTSKQLFRMAYMKNDVCACKVRGLTYLLLFVGWLFVFEPIINFFGIPLLRGLLSLSFGLAALILATTCWLSCSALACFTARPVLSSLILLTIWAIILNVMAIVGGDEQDQSKT